MKIILVFVAIVFAKTITQAQQDIHHVLKSYMPVKDALVRSDATGAALAARQLLEVIVKEPESSRETLIKTLERLIKTTDIEKQRTYFADISTEVWTLVQGENDIKETVYYHYCPMKNKYWLSYEPEIKNPYFGSKMLTCGSMSEKKSN